MYDKRLSYDLIYPYKAFAEINKKPQNEANDESWCQLATVLTTQATSLEDSPLLQDLVESFELAGELLAV
jgi:hypothetical protein